MSYTKGIIQKYIDQGVIKDNTPILTLKQKLNILVGFVVAFSILFMIVDLFLRMI